MLKSAETSVQLSEGSGEKLQAEGHVEDTCSAPWALCGHGRCSEDIPGVGGWGVALVLSQNNTGSPAVGVPGVCLLQPLRPIRVSTFPSFLWLNSSLLHASTDCGSVLLWMDMWAASSLKSS